VVKRCPFLFAILLGGCAHSGSGTTPAAPDVGAPASYPATFALLDDDARERRGHEITADLANDLEVRALHVDVFGLPSAVDVRPRSRGVTGAFDAEQAERWTKLLVRHREVLGIDDPGAFELDLVGDTFVTWQSTPGVAAPLASVTVLRRGDVLSIRGRFWPGPLPAATLDPEPIANQFVDKPYTIAWRLEYKGPHCDGCGGPPPPDRPPQSLVSTRNDVAVERSIALVCEDAGHIALRRLVRIALQPRALAVVTRRHDGWTFTGRARSTDPTVMTPRVFDAVTGEDLAERTILPVQAGDIHLPAHGWPPTICDRRP
jgi:hypothetical protein